MNPSENPSEAMTPFEQVCPDDAVRAAPDQPAPADEAPPADQAVPLLAVPEPAIAHGPRPGAGGWTLAALCLGLALIACCVLIPQADVNRALAWEHQHLGADLDQLQKQIAVNEEFLDRIARDPTLAERLAQRQMKLIREGTSVLPLGGTSGAPSSPFLLVSVPPPPRTQWYQPSGGAIASLCRDPRRRSWLLGAGLMLMATGLVLGYTPKQPARAA